MRSIVAGLIGFAAGFIAGVAATLLVVALVALYIMGGLNGASLGVEGIEVPDLGGDLGEGYTGFPGPGSWSTYQAIGTDPLGGAAQFTFTLRVEDVTGGQALLVVESEGLTDSFWVPLDSRNAIIEALALNLGDGEPLIVAPVGTVDAGPLGHRDAIAVETSGGYTLVLDSETLWVLGVSVEKGEEGPTLEAWIVDGEVKR